MRCFINVLVKCLSEIRFLLYICLGLSTEWAIECGTGFLESATGAAEPTTWSITGLAEYARSITNLAESATWSITSLEESTTGLITGLAECNKLGRVCNRVNNKFGRVCNRVNNILHRLFNRVNSRPYRV